MCNSTTCNHTDTIASAAQIIMTQQARLVWQSEAFKVTLTNATGGTLLPTITLQKLPAMFDRLREAEEWEVVILRERGRNKALKMQQNIFDFSDLLTNASASHWQTWEKTSRLSRQLYQIRDALLSADRLRPLRDALKDKAKQGVKSAHSVESIVRLIMDDKSFLRVTLCDKQGRIMREDKEDITVQALFQALGVCPRQNSTLFNDILQGLIHATMGRYEMRVLTTETDINYAYTLGNFTSCMRYNRSTGKVYGREYQDGKQSVALACLYDADGDMVARSVLRLQNNKIVRIYTSENSGKIASVYRAHGYEQSENALVGARLPIVVDDNGALSMPYIDGKTRDIRYIEDPEGDYLQIGGERGELIGDASATTGYLKVWDAGIDRGFHSHGGRDTRGDEYNCDCCGGGIDEDNVHTFDGECLCESCYYDSTTTCDDCDNRISNNDSNYYEEVYSARTGETYGACLCQSCSDEYWQSPTDGVYFHSDNM